MFFKMNKPEKYYVSLGTINGNISLPEAHHVFVGSKASWYDIVCPIETAWELSRNWPEAELIVAPSSGHSAFEKEITHELIKATEEFAKSA